MRFAGEKRVVSENRAVKAIFRDGYRPRRRELAVHPVVSERRQRQERTTIGVVEEVTLRGSKGDIRVLAGLTRARLGPASTRIWRRVRVSGPCSTASAFGRPRRTNRKNETASMPGS